MRHSRSMAVACILAAGPLLLTGCGGADTGAKKDPMPVEDTVYGDQIKQMNRVREETTRLSRERMDNLHRQIEGQEEGNKGDKAE